MGDDQLLQLTMKPDVLSVIPRLLHSRPAVLQKGCRCSRTVRNERARLDSLRAVKETLQRLSDAERNGLKRVLQVSEIVFYVRTPSGVERRTI